MKQKYPPIDHSFILEQLRGYAKLPEFEMTSTATVLTSAADHIEELETENAKLRLFAETISKQKPERPDYWSRCGQCENNISDAQELLTSEPEDENK